MLLFVAILDDRFKTTFFTYLKLIIPVLWLGKFMTTNWVNYPSEWLDQPTLVFVGFRIRDAGQIVDFGQR